ncbi:transposase [Sporolactobacillus sp. STSJ-5]|uniref:transposase n=1 Tax=Sporolactobacillus sp. STSJ-5 TaxID=2965076 RepID=UPI0021063622|nr:transposase [Sporolactobacillus sp. STSJ-5]MCQ2010431.1 transposase [Sporolactobacillus sp. STSJ-5]
MAKHYDHDYRDYVARLVVDDGRKAREIAYELEIANSTVSRWVSSYREKRNEGNITKYQTQNELARIQKEQEKEIKRLKEENEILKKAMHIFTHDQT